MYTVQIGPLPLTAPEVTVLFEECRHRVLVGHDQSALDDSRLRILEQVACIELASEVVEYVQ